MNIEVEISGEAFAPEDEMKALMEVSDQIKATAFDIADAAARVVPVDTGTLKNSILASSDKDFESQVDVSAEYAAYVEYGTIKMQAQPYLMPNFRAEGNKMIERLKAKGWK